MAEMPSIVKQNAIADPAYCPYCMRCPGLRRMRKIETLYWKCSCGAEHDEREIDAGALPHREGQ